MRIKEFEMITNIVISLTLFFAAVTASAKAHSSGLYNLKVQNLESTAVTLSEYKGKVLLVVNTASGCGYTPQYNDLEEIFQKYKGQGFVVLAFPSNDFGGQEPGTNQEIKKFCDLKNGQYKISFPLYGKSNVNSEPKNAVFKFLTESANSELKGPVKWNFEKFLISKNGKLVKRFASGVLPTSSEVIQLIEKELK